MRTALVGLGRWAEAHMAAARRSDLVEVVGCFTRSEERRAAFAARHQIAWPAPSYDALLNDPGVDAIVLSTPNDTHVAMTYAALEAGKAVLVDKPVSVDTAEGLALLRRAGTSPPLAVAHHARRLAGHRAQKAWIETGEAGEVRMAQGVFSNIRGASMAPDAWHRHVRGAEAGVLIQVGIHQVDNVLHLLGPAVTVNARFAYGDLGPNMPITAATVIVHASGAVSTVTSSWTSPSQYRLVIEATGGTMEYQLDHRHWTSAAVDAAGALSLSSPDGQTEARPTTAGDPLRDQLDDLARALGDGTSPGVSVLEGLRAVAVVEAAVISAADRGAPVDVAVLVREAGGTADEIGAITGR